MLYNSGSSNTPTVDLSQPADVSALNDAASNSGGPIQTQSNILFTEARYLPGSGFAGQGFYAQLAPGQVDETSISLEAGNLLTFTVNPNATPLLLSIDILDPTNAVIAHAEAGAASQRVTTDIVPITLAGNYTFRVTNQSNASGEFFADALLNTVFGDDEPTGTTTDLNPVTSALPDGVTRATAFGVVQNGSNSYTFDVGQGEVFSLALAPRNDFGNGLTPELRLYDPDGRLLALGVAGTLNKVTTISDVVAQMDGQYRLEVSQPNGFAAYTVGLFKGANYESSLGDLVSAFGAGTPVSDARAVTVVTPWIGPTGTSLGGNIDGRRLLNVAVVGDANAADLVAQINGDDVGNIAAFNATLVSASDIDTSDELNQYDLVVLTGQPFDDPALANAVPALWQWQQDGHGIVTVGIGAMLTTEMVLSGNFSQFDDIVALDMTKPVLQLVENTAVATTGSHAIAAGLRSSFQLFGVDLVGTPDPDADVALATADGRSIAAAKQVGYGRAVALAPDYGDPGTPGTLRSAEASQLLGQALLWASGSLPSQDGIDRVIAVSAGDTVTVSVDILNTDPGLPSTTLTTTIEVLRQDGGWIADSGGTSLPVTFTADADEVLIVRVHRSGGGGYELKVAGATGVLPLVASTSIATTGAMATPPVIRGLGNQIRVDFSAPIDLTSQIPFVLSVDGSAGGFADIARVLTLDGQSADSVTAIDGNTLVFTLAEPLADGAHTLSIMAGVLRSVDGRVYDGQTIDFVVDSTPPRIVDSTIAPGAVIDRDDFDITLTFSETLEAGPLANTSIGYLYNSDTNQVVSFDTVVYDEATATLHASTGFLEEGHYTLYLFDQFRDRAGNRLDGFPNVSLPTGDGQEDGFAALDFTVLNLMADTLALAPVDPPGGQIYSTTLVRTLSQNDIDGFQVTLEPGVALSLAFVPLGPLAATVELIDSTDTVVAWATTDAAGDSVIVPPTSVAGGVYTVRVVNESSVSGRYQLTASVNAVISAEAGGISDNTAATAIDLVSSAMPLAPGAERMGAVGDITSAGDVDMFAIAVGAGERIDLGLGLQPGSTGALDVTIIDPNGIARALSAADSSGIQRIDRFVADMDGTYLIRIAAASGNPVGALERYALAVTRNAQLAPGGAEGVAVTASAVAGRVGPTTGDLAGGIRVAVLGVDSAAVRAANALNDSTAFHFNAVAVDGSALDTVGELKNYDVVILGDTSAYPQLAAMAPALKEFVLEGGAVVSTGYTVLAASYAGASQLQALDDIVPVNTSAGYYSVGNTTFTPGAQASQITEGVGTIFVSSMEFPSGGADPGATVLAGTAAAPQLAISAPGLGRSVYVGIPFAGGAAPTANTALDRLFEQAVAWAARDGDSYVIDLALGETVHLAVTAPFVAAGDPASALDPILTLTGPNGQIVAINDNAQPGSVDAAITYTAAAAGRYELRITSPAGRGDYVLTSDVEAAPASFAVTGVTPADGAPSHTPPTEVSVTFSDNIDLTTVAPGDLTIDGLAANAVRVVDGRTLAFDVSGLVTAEGSHTIAIAADALLSVAGSGLTAFTSHVSYDLTAPTVVSVAPATAVAPLTIVNVEFNEAIDPASVQPGDLLLTDPTGHVVGSYAVSVSGNVVSFRVYGSAVGGQYTAQIGPDVTDVAGNRMTTALVGTFTLLSPDLVITSVTTQPSAQFGDRISVTYTVQNIGTAAMKGTWSDQIDLSPDTESGQNPDGSFDTYLATATVTDFATTPLAIGGSYTKTVDITLPYRNTTLAAGTYYLLVKANPYFDGPAETRHDNNTVASNPIGLSLPPSANLVVQALSVPASEFFGESVTLHWTDFNAGTGDATGMWSDRVYWSSDATLSMDYYYGDPLLEVLFVDRRQNPLAAGQGIAQSATVTIPYDASSDPSRTYYFFIVTDADGAVYEHQAEEDNVASAPTAPSLPPLYDLRVDSTTLSSTTPAWGDIEQVTYTVTNYGTGTITGDWVDRVSLTARPQGYAQAYLLDAPVTAMTLAPGESYTRTLDVPLPLSHFYAPGDWGIQVTTDGTQRVFEYQREDNNDGPNVDIHVLDPSLPDLQVTSVLAPASAQFGATITAHYTVSNLGTAATTSGWTDRIYLSLGDSDIGSNDRLLWSGPALSGLAPGESYTRDLDLALPLDPSVISGQYTLIVVADQLLFGQSAVFESQANETNNQRSAAIGVAIPPLPDLNVTAVQAPIEAISGARVPISWTITNSGNAPVTGWTDRVYVSNDATLDGNDLQLGTDIRYDGTLLPGETATQIVEFLLPDTLSGPRYVIVQTDATGQHYEYPNEGNNTRATAAPMDVTLKDFPNLIVGEVGVTGIAASSQPLEITWRVDNIGTGPTTVPVWKDYVYLSTDTVFDGGDLLLGVAENPSYLAPGQSYASRLTAILPRGIQGTWHVIVVADRENGVFEYRAEGDNTRVSDAFEVTLSPPPDLTVTAVGAPNTAVTGDPIDVSYTVVNVGGGRTFESAWTDRIYISDKETFDSSAVQIGQVNHATPLQNGDSYTNTVSVIPPIGKAGDFHIFVQTDALRQVFEGANESNNIASRNITVVHRPPPDLVSTITASPAQALAGSLLQIGYAITNEGLTATPETNWWNRIVLSSDAVLDAGDTVLDIFQVAPGNLASNGAVTGAQTVRLPSFLDGDYYLIFAGDSTDQVFEFDNVNNVTAAAIHIESKPADLTVSAVSAPDSAIAGRQINVTWTDANIGTGPTQVTPWQDRIVLSRDAILGNGDDVVLADIAQTQPIGSGGTRQTTAAVTLPYDAVGGYYILVGADRGHVIDESEETNNTGATSITVVQNVPDLVVTTVAAPSAANAGQAVAVTWTVLNQGVAATNANTWLDRIYLSTDGALNFGDIELASVRHTNALASGQGYTATANVTIPPDVATGAYRIIVVADGFSQVVEAPFEDNNATPSNVIAITGVAPKIPNLTVVAVGAPATAISGQEVTLSYTVKNTGDAMSGIWYDSLYLSADQTLQRSGDVYLGYNVESRTLDADGSYTDTFTVVIPKGYAGPYYFFVAADSTDVIRHESNEADNTGYDPHATQVVLPDPTDLAVGTFTIPDTLIPGSQATITYTIDNDGIGTARGNWYDAVYLSSDSTWDVGDRLVGRVLHKGDVAAGASYTESLTAAIPGLMPGAYQVIVRTDVRNTIDEVNEANNIGGSLNGATLDLAPLALGGSVAGTLVSGGATYYRLDVAAGQTIRLALDGLDTAANELYVSFGSVAERGKFDIEAAQPFEADQELIIPDSKAGTYYIAVVNGSTAGDPDTTFTLSAESLPFSIRSITSSTVGNSNLATIEIDGARFDGATRFGLVDAEGQTLAPTRILISDASRAFATFDLFGTPAGAYSVAAVAGDGSVRILTDALTVVDDNGGAISDGVDGPSAVRRFSTNSVTYFWTNTGDADIAAPLIRVTVSGEGGIGINGSSLHDGLFLAYGSSTEGFADTMRPGQQSSVTLAFKAGAVMDFDTVSVDSAEPIEDWTAINAALKPNDLTDAQWLPFITRIEAGLTPQWGALAAFVNRVANEVSAPGESLRDVAEIFSRLYARTPDFRVDASAAGTLVDSQSGEALGGLTLAMLRLVDGGYEYGGATVTAADGSFVISGLMPGDYIFTLASGTPYTLDLDRDGHADTNIPVFTIGSTADLTGLTLAAVDEITQADIDQDMAPLIVSDSDGVANVFWNRNGEIWHATFDGTDWVDAQPISVVTDTGPIARGAEFAAAAAANLIDGVAPGLIIVWKSDAVGDDPNTTDLYYAIGRKTATGIDWSKPVKVAGSTVADDSPQVAVMSDGSVLITYRSKDLATSDDADLYYTHIGIDGASLTFSSTAWQQLQEAIRAALAALDGQLASVGGDLTAESGLLKTFNFSIKEAFRFPQTSLAPIDFKIVYEIAGQAKTDTQTYADAQASVRFAAEAQPNKALYKALDLPEVKVGVSGEASYQAKWKAIGCDDPDWQLTSARLNGKVGVTIGVSAPIEKYISAAPALPAKVIGTLIQILERVVGSEIKVGLDIGGAIGGSWRWNKPDAFPVTNRPADNYTWIGDFTLKPNLRAEFAGGTLKVSVYGQGKLSGDILPDPALDGTLEFGVTFGGSMVTDILNNYRGAGSSSDASKRGFEDELKFSFTIQVLKSHGADLAGADLFALGDPSSYTIELVQTPAAASGTTAVREENGAHAIEASVATDITEDGGMVLTRGPDGRIYGVWSNQPDQNEPGASTFSLSVFDGTAWSAPIALAGTELANSKPTLAFDANGALVVVWSEISDPADLAAGAVTLEQLQDAIARADSADLFYGVYANGVWSGKALLTDQAGGDGAAQIARAGNTLVATWINSTVDGTADSIFASVWDGIAWTAPSLVGSGPGVDRVTVGAAAGAPIVLWTEQHGTADLSRAVVMSSRFDGLAWTAKQAFAPTLSVAAASVVDASRELAAKQAALTAGAIAPESAASAFFGPPERKSEAECDLKAKKTHYAPELVRALDPNEISGPQGVSEENWVTTDAPFGYRIDFENLAGATAPAQVVKIIQQLDSDLDIRTFRIGSFGWNGSTFADANARSYFVGRIDQSASGGPIVDVTMLPDQVTNTLTWTFTTIDPQTGEPTQDARGGFLPPTDGILLGTGFVSYTIMPKPGLPTGTRIDALATVVFDTEAPLDTPAIFNTIDAVKPTSAVAALPSEVDGNTIELDWSGLDDPTGSGIATYSVYVSTDGQPYMLLLLDTTQTTALFTGQAGRTYAFYSIATDFAGNVESAPSAPDAVTTFGATAAGSASGRVFVDANANGLSDLGDSGVAGVTVFLDANGNAVLDEGETSTLTDAFGRYTFGALAPGAYTVALVTPEGETTTTPASRTVTVVGESDTTVPAFGLFTPGSISGVVYEDLNQSGQRDGAEAGLAGRTVYIDANDNGRLDVGEINAVTASDGSYRFEGLAAGPITLRQVVPAHNAATGADHLTLTVTSGLAAANRNFGSIALASVSGVKFEDITGDGVRQADEPLLAGWTIFLDANQNGLLDNGERSVVTGADGTYRFEDVLPGVYNIAEVLKPGWQQTDPAPGASSASGLLATTASSALLESPDLALAGTDPLALGDAQRASVLTGLDAYRADPLFAGQNGHGVRVVTIDTGINIDSPFFGPDLDNDGVSDRIVFQWDFADNDGNATDVLGHGSNVASIIAGSDAQYGGVAPEADIIALKVFSDSGAGYFLYVEKALQWVVANAQSYGIGVVNLSLGDGGNWISSASRYGLGDELAALASEGVIVTAAAGNSYYTFQAQPGVSYPAADPNVIAVGAVWTGDYNGPWRFTNGAIDYSTSADAIASFSQRGPLTDVFAPGARLTGAGAGSDTVTMQGTSQASAYLAGVATLAQDIALETLGRLLSGAEFATLVQQTGIVIIDGDNENDDVRNTGAQYLRVDVDAMARGILAMAGSGGAGGGGGSGGGGGVGTPTHALDGYALTIGAGDQLTAVDFGNFHLGTVSGTLFDDLDGSGSTDPGEGGLSGRTVFIDANDDGLFDAGDISTTTDATGHWSFADLGPGAITIRQVVPSGWGATTPAFTASITSGATLGASLGARDLPPSVVGDGYSVDENAALVVSAAQGVLANDSDAGGGLLTAELVSGPTHGQLTLNGDGSFTYTPASFYSGLDAFRYAAVDSAGNRTLADVAITVNHVGQANHSPVAHDDGPFTFHGTSVTVSAATLLGNDSDVDQDPLSVTGVGSAQHGTVAFDGISVVYTVAAGYVGADSFTYTVADGLGGVATATVSVEKLNDPPVAGADSAATDQGTAITIDVGANDHDTETPDGLLVFALNGSSSNLGAALRVDSHGRFVYDPTSSATLQGLNPGERASDTFSYTLTDQAGASVTGVVTVTVEGRARTLQLVATTNEDTPITVPVSGMTLLSAMSRDGQVSIVAQGLRYDPTQSALLQSLNPRNNPSLVDVVSFTARNAKGEIVWGELDVTVTGVEDAPVAGSMTVATESDMTTSVDALALVRDADLGAIITLQSFQATTALGATVQLVSGHLVYDPAASLTLAQLATGQIANDSFNYTVSDETGRTATGLVKVVVSGHTADVITFPARSTGEDTPIVFQPGGGITPIGVNAQSALGADLKVVAGGNLSYDPRLSPQLQALESGQSASDSVLFTFRQNGVLKIGVIAVTVTGAAEPFVTRDDSATAMTASSTTSGPAVTIDVAKNDSLPVGTTIGVPSTSALGAALSVVNGKVVYNAAASAQLAALAIGATATDTFIYTARGPNGEQSIAKVTVTVTGVNTPPIGRPDTYQVSANVTATLDVLANDSDLQNSPLRISSLPATTTLGATLVLLGDGTIAYDPTAVAQLLRLKAGETATDTFAYKVADPQGVSTRVQVTITVSGVNDAPLAKDDRTTTFDNVPTLIDVLANDSSPDLVGPLRASVGAASTLGVALSVDAAGRVVYDPTAALAHLADGQQATDTFTYTVTDPRGLASSATVTVTVIGRNAPPVAHDDAVAVTADPSTPAVISVLTNDTDVDDGAIVTVLSVASSSELGAALIVNGDGTISFDVSTSAVLRTLAAGETRTDRFTYTVVDQFGAHSTATVTVTVTGAPRPLMTTAGASSQPEPYPIDLGRPFDSFSSLSVSSGATWQQEFVCGTQVKRSPNTQIKLTL